MIKPSTLQQALRCHLARWKLLNIRDYWSSAQVCPNNDVDVTHTDTGVSITHVGVSNRNECVSKTDAGVSKGCLDLACVSNVRAGVSNTDVCPTGHAGCGGPRAPAREEPRRLARPCLRQLLQGLLHPGPISISLSICKNT